MQPLGFMMAMNTQQLMDEDVWVKATGEWFNRLVEDFGVDPQLAQNNRINITPMDIVGEFDMIVGDGSIPGQQDVDAWVSLIQTLGEFPDVLQRLDMVKVFKHLARELGVSNVEQFMRPPQVREDEDVLAAAQQGNAVPVEEFTQAAT